jgi:arylsulfatase A-like enzyme
MSAPNVLVVAVDGLRASALGAYGNTAFATPALDQFAAESFLLDCCYAPTCDLPNLYRAFWRSEHSLRRHQKTTDSSLPRTFAAGGYETVLVSDEPDELAIDLGESFGQYVRMASLQVESESNARDLSDTSLARLFAAACDAIQSPLRARAGNHVHPAAPRLIWVHSCGMYGPWDAPLRLQETLLDEGDPSALETTIPPDVELTRSGDPDTAFRYYCAYAAQIMVLDSCWAALMETLAAVEDVNSWLVVLMGVRGFPLGEHLRIGGIDQRLYGEQLHVPWLIRFPDGRGALARSHALTSHLDLLPTIVDFSSNGADAMAASGDGTSILPLIAEMQPPQRDWLLSTNSASSSALRTANWCLRRDAIVRPDRVDRADAPPVAELFVRPDDRWEANDIAKLCPEVVEQLTEALDQVSQQIVEGRPMPASIEPLPRATC